MNYLDPAHIPDFFKEFYNDLSKISFLIKKEVKNMRPMSHTADYADSALEYINKRLKAVGQDNQHLGKIPEHPRCFLDGHRFFKAGLPGFAITCIFRGRLLIIDPISDAIYACFHGELYINGALVKKTVAALELLTHHSHCNSLLLVFKKLGQTKNIQLDPQGELQQLL